MAICANCGKEIDEGAKFCTNCGAPVQHMQAPAQAGACVHAAVGKRGILWYNGTENRIGRTGM